jgi:superfamily II DNA or RNA helicase
VIIDEVHHIRGGGEWHVVAHDIDARYKIGLSATAFLDSKTEQERGAIWMLAVCGPVRVNIETSLLVKEGWLMKQHVKFYPVTVPDMHGARWSQTLYKRCVTLNMPRNRLIAKLAKEQVEARHRVLIVARHHDHIHCILEALEDVGLVAERVTGKESKAQRDDAVEALIDRRVDVLVGNVLGEGIDLPEVEVIINAEGGKDDKNTVQRQRNLTISKGKTSAIMIDFLDETNEKFAEHSANRRAMYESESAFVVEVMPNGC